MAFLETSELGLSEEPLETTGNGIRGNKTEQKACFENVNKVQLTTKKPTTAETGVTTAKLIIQDLIFKFYNLSFLIRFKRDHQTDTTSPLKFY